MAFKLRQDVYHVQTRRALLNNSLTVQVGDVVIPLGASSTVTNATAAVAGATFYVLGVVTGFSQKNGEVVSQGQNPATTPSQVVTASDNTTNAQVYAMYVPITPEMEFSALLSATATTTAGSDQAFAWFNLTDARTVNEASVVAATAGATVGQVFSFGVDPEDTTNHSIICRFAKAVMSQP
jgi:hypothetical protein